MSRALVWTLATAVASAAAGCAENEQTFYIEHMKTQPDAPECSVAAGDAATLLGSLDISFGNAMLAHFLVANHAVSRESYETARAESNGIFVDYAEVYVLNSAGDVIGDRIRQPIERFIEPETSSVVPVELVPKEIVDSLQLAYLCPPLQAENYPPLNGLEDYLGNAVPRDFDRIRAVLRFFGHTQGGKEVETQEYPVGIELCCGCMVSWGNCLTECEAFCAEPEESGMCIGGTGNGGKFDCRMLYYNPGATWTCPEDEENVDTDTDFVRQCSCEADC